MIASARRTASAAAIEIDRSFAGAPVVLAVLAVALLVRVAISEFFAPNSGFGVDVTNFSAWAYELADKGPGGFYKPGYWADYPPGYLYLLWGLGSLARGWTEATGGTALVEALIKVPAILGDVAGGAMLFFLVRRFFDRRVAVAAAAVYVLNPGVIFDSAVWGQIDGFGTFILLAALYALARGWTEASSALAVLAALVKFQFAFLIPIIFVVGLKRHVWGRSSDAALDGRRDYLRVLTSLSAGVVTMALLIWPFGLSLYSRADPSRSLWDKFVEIAGTYPGLSVNAFNLWMNPISNLAAQDGAWGDDRLPVVAIGSFTITWQLVGAVLFFAVAALAFRVVWRRDDAPALLFAVLLVSVAFFVLPTRVHERYLFPALAFAAPFVVRSWGWRAAYGVLSISFFLNIYYAYTVGYFNNPDVVRDPLLGATLLSPPGIYLLSFTSVLVLVWLCIRALRPAELPAGSVALAAAALPAPHHADDPPPPVRAPAPEPARPLATITAASRAAAGTDDAGPRTSPLARLRAWLRPREVEPGERSGGGRLTARDLALFATIVLIALVFRLWRLEAPVAMHFDEVYHARSAAEWLANWEFDADRDVYEWTHPMMAKYLIAAGIVAADPNRVVAATDLETTPDLVAVAPERELVGRARSVSFTAEGSSEVVVRDVGTGDELGRWPVPEPPGALAFDDDENRLVVGSATSGTVYSFRASWDGGEPPADAEPEMTVTTDLDGIAQIAPLPSGSAVALRGADGLAVVDLGTGAVTATSDLVAGGIGYFSDVGGADGSTPAIGVTTVSDARLQFLDPATLEELTAPKSETSCPNAFEDQQGTTGACVRKAVTLPSPPLGPFAVQGSGDEQRAFVPLDAADGENAFSVVRSTQTTVEATVPLPGEPRDVLWNHVTNIVYVTGADRVWTIEPHGEERNGGDRGEDFAGYSVFDETQLGGEPVAMALDASSHSPGEDHERLLVATRGDDHARLVTIDAGSNAFAWRFGGVIFGAILAGLVYLLAASIFDRRRIGVLAGLFVAFDAMSFAQSRIAMNDVYVAVFIVAAYLVFWQIWSGRWARSAWWALPVVGVLIGLAAGTKWVGFYALAGISLLVLARSDLGRVVLLASAAFLFIVAGIGSPWPFAAVLVGMVALLAVMTWVRPVRLGWNDLRALPSTGVVAGIIGLAFTVAAGPLDREGPVRVVVELLATGAERVWPAALMIAPALGLMAWRAILSRRDPDSDRRWYLPSEMGGFSWAWIGASLFVVPMVVYTLTFIPYLQLGHTFTENNIGPGYGWSFEELHTQMFGYHFELQSGHPAASPWWSWPAVLRPVWFYQGNFDGQSIAVIYNGGNLVLFWLGVPAVIYCAVQAWRRQSLGLLLITVAFAAQWLPWTRIERPTFLYHYFTAMPFFMLALAYLADDALRRRSTAGIAIGVGLAAVVVGVLLYPIAGALPMPDWYIYTFNALPPWNFQQQFPGPPQGERELIGGAGLVRLIIATVAAVAAALFAVYGRGWIDRSREAGPPSGPGEALTEPG